MKLLGYGFYLGVIEKYSRWLKIEEAYRKNYRVLVEKYSELCERYKGKYLAVCNAKILGVFDSFEEAASNVYKNCSSHAFIIRICGDIREEIKLGFPMELIQGSTFKSCKA